MTLPWPIFHRVQSSIPYSWYSRCGMERDRPCAKELEAERLMPDGGSRDVDYAANWIPESA